MLLKKIRSMLEERGIGALLVTDELNVRYVTGFDVSDAYVLLTHDTAYLLTDFRYYEAATKALSGVFEIVTPRGKLDFVKNELATRSISTIGFEGNSATYSFYQTLSERLNGISISDVGCLFSELRAVKSEEEIRNIQIAQDIADRAFSELLKVLTPNMTEIEVAAELEYLMKKGGSEATAFQTIAVSGDASALPHGVPRNIKLKKGFLTMDFGAKHKGYCSDMTRTVVIGCADSEMRKLYGTVLDAQLSALEYLHDGRDCGEADAIARRLINAEYPEMFGHSLGHGVGLLVHEAPSLSSRCKGSMLVPGNVVTVEPGIYVYGKYGCRIEDMVTILPEGIHNFTNSTKELIEIT